MQYVEPKPAQFGPCNDKLLLDFVGGVIYSLSILKHILNKSASANRNLFLNSLHMRILLFRVSIFYLKL